jgi:hypothetical protein
MESSSTGGMVSTAGRAGVSGERCSLRVTMFESFLLKVIKEKFLLYRLPSAS